MAIMLETGWTYEYMKSLTYPQLVAMIAAWSRKRQEELNFSKAILGVK